MRSSVSDVGLDFSPNFCHVFTDPLLPLWLAGYWVNNCIGLSNLKFFMQVQFYAVAWFSLGAYVLLPKASQLHATERTWADASVYYGGVFSGLAAFMVFYNISFALVLVYTNMTNLEYQHHMKRIQEFGMVSLPSTLLPFSSVAHEFLFFSFCQYCRDTLIRMIFRPGSIFSR